MSIMPYAPPRVEPEHHTAEPTPVELLIPPADDPCPCVRESARYVVGRRRFKALGRDAWQVWDRVEDRLAYWSIDRRSCEDRATDLNAEDWPDCGRWWEVQAPCEHFDRPVRLAGAPSQAVADRTIDRLALAEFPPF